MSEDSSSRRPESRRPLTRRGKVPFVAQAVVAPPQGLVERKTRPLDQDVFNASATYHHFHQADTQPIPQLSLEQLETLDLAELAAFHSRDTEILPHLTEDLIPNALPLEGELLEAPSQEADALIELTDDSLSDEDTAPASPLDARPKIALPPSIRRTQPVSRLITTPEVLDALTESVSTRHPRPKLPPGATALNLPLAEALDAMPQPEVRQEQAAAQAETPPSLSSSTPLPPPAPARKPTLSLSTFTQPSLPAANPPTQAVKRPILRSSSLPAVPTQLVPDTTAQPRPNVPDTVQDTRPNIPDTAQDTHPNVPDTVQDARPSTSASEHESHASNTPDTLETLSPSLRAPSESSALPAASVPDTTEEVRPSPLPLPSLATRPLSPERSPRAFADTREHPSLALAETGEQPNPALAETAEQFNPALADTMEQLRPVLPELPSVTPNGETALGSTLQDLSRHSPLETLWPEVENEAPLLSKTTPVNPLRLQVTEIIPAISDPEADKDLSPELAALAMQHRQLQREHDHTLDDDAAPEMAQVAEPSLSQTFPRLRAVTPEDIEAARQNTSSKLPSQPSLPRAERVPTLGFHQDLIADIVAQQQPTAPLETPDTDTANTVSPPVVQEQRCFREQATELHPRPSTSEPVSLTPADLVNPTPQELQRLLDKSVSVSPSVQVKSFREQATELHPRVNLNEEELAKWLDPQMERTDLRPRVSDSVAPKRSSWLEEVAPQTPSDYDPSDRSPSLTLYNPPGKVSDSRPLYRHPLFWVASVGLLSLVVLLLILSSL